MNLLSCSIVVLTRTEHPYTAKILAVVRITIEKLSKFTKYHQNGENFRQFIFKNSTTYYFLITNLNHPKNSKVPPDTHPKRVPPSAPALAETTYKGGSIAVWPANGATALQTPTSPDSAVFLSEKMISTTKNSRTSKIFDFSAFL